MRFLRDTDYYRLIQYRDLNELLTIATEDSDYNPQQLLIDSEASAIETVKSYLSARYDIDRALADTPVYDNLTTYYGQSRVQYHEEAYDENETYTTGDRVSHENKIYEANQDIFTPEAFDSVKWDYVCLDYALFYALTPASEFQELTNYIQGSVVWNYSDNRTYTALKNTNGASLNNAVYSEYGADKDRSLYVEDLSNSVAWQQGSVYSFDGILPTDGTKWVQGDNRSALLIEKLIDITLYNIHSVPSQRNVQQIRMIRYDGARANQVGGAMEWLKKVADGSISANIPQKTPIQGLRIIFGSSAPKSNNTY